MKRKVKINMTILQFIGILTIFMTVICVLVFIRYGQIKEELLAQQEELATREGIDMNISYIYTPTEGYEITDGFMPNDVEGMDEFNKVASMIAQTLYGEARGLSEYEQSLVVWTILNRFDSGYYGSSIEEVITAPNQFIGYSESNPIDGHLYNLAVDVLMRWSYESYSVGDVGRTLPKEYLGFYGKGGHNWFRDRNGNIFDFTTYDPYRSKGGL